VLGLRDALAGETLAQRCERPSLERGRADVIVAGLTILLAALQHCGAETLVVRDRGLRYALA
jgi:exopolyphosphatase/guanosine-5'-triphosphate,3'-diphosphate pyrophosphatase